MFYLNEIVIVESARNGSLKVVDLKGVVQVIVTPQSGNDSWPTLSELSTIGRSTIGRAGRHCMDRAVLICI